MRLGILDAIHRSADAFSRFIALHDVHGDKLPGQYFSAVLRDRDVSAFSIPISWRAARGVLQNTERCVYCLKRAHIVSGMLSSIRHFPLFVLCLVRFNVHHVTENSNFFKKPFGKFLANFERPVRSCIEAKFCKQILVWKLLTRSTRFTHFCTAKKN